MRKNIVKNIIKERTSFVYISAVILKHTKNIGNVYVKHQPRVYGFSNYRLLRLVQLMLKVLVNYSKVGSLIAVTKHPQFEVASVKF